MSEHKEKRRYTREFKVEAVRLYEASEKSMREIEQELGITPYLLSKWVQQFREREAAAFPGKGKLPETEVELQRLRREVEILRQERDILKKAVIIFSEPKR
jgi:transposase-like protein